MSSVLLALRVTRFTGFRVAIYLCEKMLECVGGVYERLRLTGGGGGLDVRVRAIYCFIFFLWVFKTE